MSKSLDPQKSKGIVGKGKSPKILGRKKKPLSPQ
jgi:hypothetical protein